MLVYLAVALVSVAQSSVATSVLCLECVLLCSVEFKCCLCGRYKRCVIMVFYDFIIA